MSPLGDVIRRLRYGKPIAVVSGLPRSGTSMAMKMLEAGGMPVLVDGLRKPDVSNPNGYYEFEPVKELDKGGDVQWLADARGRAVKIISFLLTYLPETYEYRVIFMRRDLHEAVASQNTMLAQRGESRDGVDDERILASRSCFSTLTIAYEDVVQNPSLAAHRMNEFLGGTLDVVKMAAVADPALYRNRRHVEV
jgi:hypothetical protein